jgi:hypothetical protein
MIDLQTLLKTYDGPVPRAEWAAARWGEGAWQRLRRGADAALIEARLREAVSWLGRLRLAAPAATDQSRRLEHAIAEYRQAALACR